MFPSGLASLLSLIFTPLFAVTVQSTICRPLVTPLLESSVTTTTDATQIINGKASQSVLVSIYDNSQQVASVTSDSLGGFSLQVSLIVGENNLTATSANDCSSETSAPLVISRSAIPVTQTTSPSEPSSVAVISTPSDNATGTSTETTNDTSTQSVPVVPSGTDSTQPFILKLITPESSQSTTTGTAHNSSTTITTTDQSVYLKGITRPSAVVTISDNSREVARTTAAYDGTFGISVPLSYGTNILSIEASIAGHVTTQILTYIRNPPANPWLSIGPIVSLVIIVIVGIVVVIRRRFQLQRKK